MNNKPYALIILVLLMAAVFFSFNRGSGPAKAEESFVFIGNSLTSYNGLPQLLQETAAANGKNITVLAHTRGGAELGELYEDPAAVNLVKQHRPDFLVIQEQSQTVDGPAISKWLELAGASGSQLILYHTWVDNCQAMMAAAQEMGGTFGPPPSAGAEPGRQAAKGGLIIAPVGFAFNKFNKGTCGCPQKLSGIPILNNRGDFHPSPVGSYLAASTIYRAAFGLSPQNPPQNEIAKKYWNEILAADCATEMRRSAAD